MGVGGTESSPPSPPPPPAFSAAVLKTGSIIEGSVKCGVDGTLGERRESASFRRSSVEERKLEVTTGMDPTTTTETTLGLATLERARTSGSFKTSLEFIRVSRVRACATFVGVAID